jgi:SAM-dependent methyltransferase
MPSAAALPMKPLYDFGPLPVDRTIAPQDGMLAHGKETQYYEIGHRALELVKFSAELCNKPHYPDMLDLPCGYGRVMRWLRAHYNYARITACDLDRGGVDFCHERFGALPVYSQPDLRQLPFNAQFDLIWVGSLVTHLPLDRWLITLDCLVRWTRECGVIMLSTQGRYFASQLARGQRYIVETINKKALLAGFAQTGFAFQPYFEDKKGDYGITVTSPEWLMRTLQRYPDIIVRAYFEEAWGMQDVVILYKKAGHYKPVLGVPEMNTAAQPAKSGLLGKMLGR